MVCPKTVLVVDDEPSIREMLGVMLRRDGYLVYEAGGADAAVRTLETTCVGVMLVDRRMPGRDGDWLIAHAKERFAQTAIILATGEYVPDAVAHQRGVAGFLAKPFSVEAVRSAVSDAAVWHQVAARNVNR
jgi:DNA-binding NtrC family response regulator